MARHAAGAAAAAAPALAAVQELAAGAATAGTRIIQPVSANAAGKAHGIAQAMAPDEPGAAPRSQPAAGGAAAAAARRAIAPSPRCSRAVALLGVRHHVLRAEKHVAESSLSEHGRLVREVRRLRVAALAAAHDGLGMNDRAKFHRRDEAIAD